MLGISLDGESFLRDDPGLEPHGSEDEDESHLGSEDTTDEDLYEESKETLEEDDTASEDADTTVAVRGLAGEHHRARAFMAPMPIDTGLIQTWASQVPLSLNNTPPMIIDQEVVLHLARALPSTTPSHTCQPMDIDIESIQALRKVQGNQIGISRQVFDPMPLDPSIIHALPSGPQVAYPPTSSSATPMSLDPSVINALSSNSPAFCPSAFSPVMPMPLDMSVIDTLPSGLRVFNPPILSPATPMPIDLSVIHALPPIPTVDPAHHLSQLMDVDDNLLAGNVTGEGKHGSSESDPPVEPMAIDSNFIPPPFCGLAREERHGESRIGLMDVDIEFLNAARATSLPIPVPTPPIPVEEDIVMSHRRVSSSQSDTDTRANAWIEHMTRPYRNAGNNRVSDQSALASNDVILASARQQLAHGDPNEPLTKRDGILMVSIMEQRTARSRRSSCSSSDDSSPRSTIRRKQVKRKAPKVTHRPEEDVTLHCSVRELVLDAMGKKKTDPFTDQYLPSQDEIDEFGYRKDASIGPTIPNLRLDVKTTSIASWWNKWAAKLFVPFFRANGGITASDHDIKKAFSTHLYALHKQYQDWDAARRPGTTKAQNRKDKQRAEARATRIRGLLIRRADACKTYRSDTRMKNFLGVWKRMTVDAMSGDESDHDRGKQTYVVRRPAWRSQEAETWLIAHDALHLSKRFTPDGRATPGAFPRPRIRGVDRPSVDARWPTGLPINFYDDKWLKKLNDIDRAQLKATGRVDLTLSYEIQRLVQRHSHITSKNTPPLRDNDQSLPPRV